MARTPTETTWSMPPVTDRSAAPLRTQAVDTLRRAILSLSIEEGTRLVERELIQHLGVSRTTVREALRELESEGLVEVIPQRGAIVATISESDAADLYAARTAIEALLVRRFTDRADEETVHELLRAVDEYSTVATSEHEVVDMLEAKEKFYRVLAAGAGSPALSQLLSSLQARVQVLRARSLAVEGRPEQSAAELKELASVIASRQGEEAEKLCARHVEAAASTGLPSLREARTRQRMTVRSST